jgi:hypothetical protein
MKKLILTCLLSILVSFTGAVVIASASPLTITYSGDNSVLGGWYIRDGGAPVPFSVPAVNNWETANTVTFDLTPLSFQTYQLIWQVVNDDPPQHRGPSAVNPGGFLAEIITPEPLFKANCPSSSLWEVAVQNNLSQPGDFNSLAWSEAKEYGANNDSGAIWYQAHGGPIEGIGGTAQWIWTAANFGDPGAPSMNNSVFIRTTVNDPAPIPTPEPSTLFLISSGLISLVAFNKKFRK